MNPNLYTSRTRFSNGTLKMLRVLLLSILFLGITDNVMSQSESYNLTFAANSGNPGSINTETDATTTGWTSIAGTVGAISADQWSSNVTIPFAFNFFGTAVTSFKVSQGGVLTFSTGAVSLPGPNAALPASGLPDLSIAMMWDDFTNTPPTGSGDQVYYKVFGTAPNRQLWVRYFSFEMGNPSLSFVYMSAVLEETTNNVYVVDQYNASALGSTSVGVQYSGSFAVQDAASPSITHGSPTNGTSIADNDVWTFTPFSLLPCVDPPTSGTSVITPSTQVCPTSTVSFSLSGNSVGTGQTYQWMSGPTASGPWTLQGSPAAGAAYATTVTTSAYWRCEVICGAGKDTSVAIFSDVATLFPGGTYTINNAGGADFLSISDAITAIQCGIAGPIVFDIVPGSGPYVEQVTIPQIVGASATNTVTINGNLTTITHASTNTNYREAFLLDGADHIIIDSMIVDVTLGTYGWGIRMTNQADSNVISNCILFGPANTTSANFVGILLNNSATTYTTTGGLGDGNLIDGNTIYDFNTAIVLAGNTTSPYSQNNKITNNNIYDCYLYNINVYYNTNLEISGNTIYHYVRSTTTTTYGVYLNTGIVNAMVDRNTIYDLHVSNPTTTSSTYCFYVAGDGLAGQENKIINNLVYGIRSNGTQAGIYNVTGEYMVAYHNTFSFDDINATGGLTYGIYQSGAVPSIDVKNNMINISRAGTGTAYGLYYNTAGAYITSNYNVFNITNATPNVGYYAGTAFPTLANWQTANLNAYDQNSVSADPVFTNPLAGDFTPTNAAVNSTGGNVGVTTDFFGTARNVGAPDAGIIEWTPVGKDANISWVSPVPPVSLGNQTIIVNISNAQTATINSVELSYTDGVTTETETFSGLGLTAGNNTNLTFAVPYNLVANASLKAYVTNVNGTPDDNLTNDTTAVQTICPSMIGAYTINSGAATAGTNFASFTEAVVALNCASVSGPVVISVVPGSGPYTEQVTIGEIPGASAVNTITFKGNMETLQFNAATASQRAVLTLNGADYIVIDSLSIISNSGTYGFGIAATNGADNNKITNCLVDVGVNQTSTNFAGITFSGSLSSATSSGLVGNNNEISNNKIVGGYYGITCMGATTAPGSQNNIIENNIVEDFYVYGIYNGYNTDIVVRSNNIYHLNRTATGSAYGIYYTTGFDGGLTEKNKIYNTLINTPSSTSVAYGIYVFADGTLAKPNQLINNLIYNLGGSGTQYGIYSSGTDYLNLYHNTVVLNNNQSTAGLTYGFYQTTAPASGSTIDVKNNIISVTRAGTGNKYCMYLNTAGTYVNSDNNAFYINTPGTNNLGYYAGTNAANLTAWQALNGGIYDLNSVEADPIFASPNTGNYKPLAAAINDIGANLGVSDDILGVTRTVTPDPGAYEFTPPTLNASVTWLAPGVPLSAGLHTVQLQVLNSLTDPITSLTLAYTDGGVPVTENFTGLNITTGNSQTFSFATQINISSDVLLRGYIMDVNGILDGNQADDTTLTQNICVSLVGNYTIDAISPASATNFQSFNAAVAKLATCGVSGDVVISVVPGTGPYVEQVIIPEIAGASATSTITFKGNLETLSYASTNTNAREGIFLNGADYIRIDSLIIDASLGTYAFTVRLANNADNNIISNCVMNHPANTTSANFAGICMTNSATSATSTGDNGDDNLFEGNTINNAYYGIMILGNSVSPNSSNNKAINNTCKDVGVYGVYSTYNNNLEVSGNRFYHEFRTTTATSYGVYLTTGVSNAQVNSNRVYNYLIAAPLSTSATYGIYVIADASPGLENKIYNNVITGFYGNGTQYGIYNSGADYMQAYHNTISLDDQNGSSAATYGFYQTTAVSSVEFKNNVVNVTRNSSSVSIYALYFNTAGTYISCDYNALNCAGVGSGTYSLGRYPSVNYADLTAWKTANGGAYDQSSQSGDPLFLSPGTGDYTPQNGSFNSIGTNLGITTDILGNVRLVGTPDPGAYEWTLPGLNAGITWIGPNPPVLAGNQTISVDITNVQTVLITDVDLSYTDGVTTVNEVFSGLNITAGGSTTLTFAVPYNLTTSSVLKAYINSVNGITDLNQSNDTTANQNLCPALSGVYTVNTAVATGGTNFQSLNDAVNALECGGVVGAVTMNVMAASGPYNEQLNISAILGASSTNTITFNGNGNTINSGSSNTNERNAIYMDGADFFTFNDFNINLADSTYGWGIQFNSNADSNVVSNCTFTGPANTASTNFAGIILGGTATSATTAANSGSYNIISNNTIQNFYYPVVVTGQSTAPFVTGNRIENNTIIDAYIYGIYSLYNENPQFIGNNIYSVNRTTYTTGYGVYLSTGITGAKVEGNRIHDLLINAPTSTSTCYGIYVSSDGTLGAENRIINNLVYNLGGNGTQYGIYNTSGDYMIAQHNTVSLDNNSATTGVTYGIYQTTVVNSIEYKNNLINVERSGTGNKYCVYFNSGAGYIACDYNAYHFNSPGSTIGALGYSSGTTYSDLAAWQGALLDVNGDSANPQFVNPLIGDYTPSSIALDDAGTALGITTDINGAARDLVNPDPGAFEYNLLADDLGVLAFVSPDDSLCYTAAESVVIKIRNYGSTLVDFSITPATVYVDVTGVNTTLLSFVVNSGDLNPGGEMDVTMSAGLDMTTFGNYNLRPYLVFGPDPNQLNDSLPIVVRSSALSVGSITANVDTICVSGTVTLNMSGNYGGIIQWQESTTSNSGPWTNIGIDSVAYVTPVDVTQNTWYRGYVNCGLNGDTSNVVEVIVNNPNVLSVTPGTRCGLGPVTLYATAAPNHIIRWYQDSSSTQVLGYGDSITVNLSATDTLWAASGTDTSSASSSGTFSPIQVTEIDLGGTDQLEIQNVSSSPVDVTGWKVAVSDSYTDITSVNTIVQTLSGTMNPGDIMTWSDATGPNYWGNNLFWNPGAFPSFAGWAAILDNNNELKDVVFLNWPSANIQSASITVGSATITVGTHWSGDGIDQTTVAATDGVARQGTADNNGAADFAIIPLSVGSSNPGLLLPFAGGGCVGTRVPVEAEVTPAPALQVSLNDTICEDDSTLLQVLVGAGDFDVYSWSPSTGLADPSAASTMAAPSVTTTYILTATNTISGCVNQDTLTIKITSKPLIAPNASPSNFCGPFVSTLNAGLNVLNGELESFTSNNLIEINTLGGTAAGPAVRYPDTLVVSGLRPGSILKSVNMNLSHGFPGDLDILLQSPTGSNLVLLSDAGGSATPSLNNASITLSDTAASGVPATWPAGSTFSYRPTSPNSPDNFVAPGPGSVTSIPNPLLTDFVGDLNGDWKLFVVDDATGDTGRVVSWTLTFLNPDSMLVVWSPSTGLSNPTSYTPTATVADGTTITYTMTATNNRTGCSSTDSVTLTSNSLPQPNMVENDTTLCNPSQIYIHVADTGAFSGGYPSGTQFTWSAIGVPIIDLDSISSINGSSYSVIVTLPSGCTAASDTITVLTKSVAVVETINSASCVGGGSIEVTVTSGLPNYNYVWSTDLAQTNIVRNVTKADNQDTLDNIAAGTYYLQVYDEAGSPASCNSGVLTYVVNGANPIVASVTPTDITCNGLANGIADVTWTGGNTPYSITWSDGSFADVTPRTIALGGNYNVIVSDLSGCADTVDFTIVEPLPVSVTFTSTPESFPGALDGTVTAIPAGGTGPYTLLWADEFFSPAGSGNPLTGLAAGLYYGLVTDANSCDNSATVLGDSIRVDVLSNATLNLTAYTEGFYDGVSGLVSALLNSGVGLSSTECDTIYVELRDQLSPTTVLASGSAVLNTSGQATFTFPGSIISQNGYIAVFHRNAVQTWSDVVTFAGMTNYNFTTAATQAYGGNQVQVAPGVWAMYSGDLSPQDEFIDILDQGVIDNDIFNFAGGYVVSDLNGDGFVDIVDQSIVDNNIFNFIGSVHP